MRKNKKCRKGLDLNSTFEINGLNLDRLINIAKNRGITLYNIKKYSNKRLIVTVSFKESQNFFAIANKMCYNIKKVKDGGKAFFLLSMYRSLGIVIGAIVITLSMIVCNDLLLGVTFNGSGSIYKREVESFLEEKGVVRFSKFSSHDLSELEDEIVASNRHLTFASVKKVGTRLVINLELSKDKVETLKGDVYQLISPVSGVIESMKIYRGTAVKGVGEQVLIGDLIVDGYATVKEQTVKINVLANVTLICKNQYVYEFSTSDKKEQALLLAEEELLDKDIIDSNVEIKKTENKYQYIVTLSFRHVLCVG